MMSAPSITLHTTAITVPKPEISPDRTPVVIIGAASSIAFRSASN
jgi:hypothetical protein